MAYKVLSWNVEHFSYRKTEEDKVAQHIRERDPDVFGLYEVEDAGIYQFMRDKFPGYTMFLTGGQQTQEILVAVREGKFDHVSFEQRTEFKEGNEYLRPGALLSVAQGQRTHSLLFVHTDSGTEASAFGNRARMLERALSLKTRLDQIVGGQANFLVLGDMNTMGLKYPRQGTAHVRVREDDEVDGLADWAANFKKRNRKADMVVLRKDKPKTWTSSDGRKQSNLDQVLAGAHMKFTPMGQDVSGEEAQVKVEGWQGLTGAAFREFVKNLSDHCSLFFEVT